MVMIILASLLVAGIAFYQAVQGLFSSLIMAVLAILCAAVAFQFYEPLAALLYTRQPAHADAICLVAVFVVPLLVLRLVLDRVLSGNVVVGLWPDRIAGGALGLIAGMVAVGVLTIAIQMLPTGPRWLMYRPFNDALQTEQELAPFYPDKFTLGLMNVLSEGSLQSGRSFRSVHDNLLLELWCARNRVTQVRQVENEPQTERIGRLDARPDSLGALACYEPNDPVWWADVPRDPLMEDLGRILIVRTPVDETARDRDNWWRLPATHFRLAARRGKADPNLVSHYPVAYLTAFESNRNDWSGNVTRGTDVKWKPFGAPVDGNTNPKLINVGQLAVERPWKVEDGPKHLVIDWVFRIGREEAPEFLVFRRTASQPVRAVNVGMPQPAAGALDRIANKQ